MQFTFLIPPVLIGKREVERVFGCTYGLYPIPNIFFLYVATVFLKKNFKVKYIDGPILDWKAKDFSDFLARDGSQVYLFYSVNLSKDTDLKALEQIKAIHPDTWVVFMGPSPTYTPFEYLIYDRTIVIRGEMEQTAAALADQLPRLNMGDSNGIGSIAGISFRLAGRIMHDKEREPLIDIDGLPFPARNLIHKHKYYNPKLGKVPFTALLTSRGCCFSCRYCVPNSQSFARELAFRSNSHDFRKPKVTIRSYENVYLELEELKRDGYKAISIIDDQFIWDGEREIKIAQDMKKFGFVWGCLSRADRITKNIAQVFSKSNCRYVDIGVESFSQEVIDDIHKGASVERMYKGIQLLKKYAVPVKLNILLGASPKETVESIRNTMKVAKSLKVDAVMVSICNPFPGTEFWKIALDNKWLLTDKYLPVDVQKSSTINYPHLSAEILEREVKRANFNFFLRPGFFLKYIDRLKTPSILLKDAKALFKKLTFP